MPIYLTDAEVRGLVSVDEAAEVIERMFLDEAKGLTEQTPTTELHLPRGFFRVKVGGAYGANSFGLKAYLGNAGYRVFVYDLEKGFDGLVEAYEMTEIRTGAVSAVATKYLSRPDSHRLGIIGTGREARAQLRAVSAVRTLSQVKAFSRTPEPREAFVADMKAELGLNIVGVDSAEECIHDADIIVTITNASEPVFDGSLLPKGVFVCGVGATGVQRREIDAETITKASIIVVEHIPTAVAECGDLLYAVANGAMTWDAVHELKDIVSGKVPARASQDDITLFDSIGTGAEDVAMAAFVLAKARAAGIGLELPIPPPFTRRRP
jgi:ornithine cyclodeaminase/alanine dehydrogenase-like protein (mu-crystallin family)